MKNNLFYILLLFASSLFAQNDSLTTTIEEPVLIVKDSITKEPYNPLAPSRAAFYSAVLPGLGQAYNKKYWKIPIVYAGIGTGVYFYIQNDNEYNRFRDAFKRRNAGFTDDEFFGDGAEPVVSTDRLIDAQDNAKKNRDISLIVAVAFYLVNIIDANVDAHLRQYNVSEDLSLEPKLNLNPINARTNYGLSLTFNLK